MKAAALPHSRATRRQPYLPLLPISSPPQAGMEKTKIAEASSFLGPTRLDGMGTEELAMALAAW